ncbi:hypothetical protein SGLAM104S_04793 [Streptomyces glaucescens]
MSRGRAPGPARVRWRRHARHRPRAVARADRPGSVPHGVLAERHPAIIRQVQESIPYDPERRRALDALLANCTEGVVEPLPADAPDLGRWREWGLADHVGRPWFDLPWLWSESYFYRQLLQAAGDFTPGPWQGVDPFRPAKLAELDAPQTDEELAALDALADRPADERSRALLHGSLWGNRADLSFRLSAEGADTRAAAPGLVADDSETLWSLLPPSVAGGTLCLVADNAGRELVPDLLLIADLLDRGRIARAILHLKPHPYYVSDATTADVLDALRRLHRGTRHRRRVRQAAVVRDDRRPADPARPPLLRRPAAVRRDAGRPAGRVRRRHAHRGQGRPQLPPSGGRPAMAPDHPLRRPHRVLPRPGRRSAHPEVGSDLRPRRLHRGRADRRRGRALADRGHPCADPGQDVTGHGGAGQGVT